MHDIRAIRDNPEVFDEGLRRRGLAPRAESLIALDEKRRTAIADLQRAQERRNASSKQVGLAMARKDTAAAEDFRAEVAGLKAVLPELEAAEKRLSEELDEELAAIPNLPLEDAPDGKDENDNVEIRRWGAPPSFPEGFKPREHFEIGEALGLMDFDARGKALRRAFRGAEGRAGAAGAGADAVHARSAHERAWLYRRSTRRFWCATRRCSARRNCQNSKKTSSPYTLDRQADKAFWELFNAPTCKTWTPQEMQAIKLVCKSCCRHHQTRPSAIRSGSSLQLKCRLPISCANASSTKPSFRCDSPPARSCFRAEAGAAGKDTRGMIRQHQFEKVELVSIATPEESRAEHERMTACAEEVLKRLGLHFRTVALCAGDLGFASRKTYDLEVWLPGQGRFREISSCSLCGDFQARRMNARSKAADAKSTRFVHTLNGSGVAVGRALVAVLENYQQADGSVTIPEVLRPYMGGLTRIGAQP